MGIFCVVRKGLCAVTATYRSRWLTSCFHVRSTVQAERVIWGKSPQLLLFAISLEMTRIGSREALFSPSFATSNSRLYILHNYLEPEPVPKP